MASDDASEGLMLRDDKGHYYFVPNELLAQCRISDDEASSMQRQPAESEVMGHDFGAGQSLFTYFVSIEFGTLVLGSETGQATSWQQYGPSVTLPDFDSSSPL